MCTDSVLYLCPLCRRIPIKQPKIVDLFSDGRSIDVLGVHLTRTEIMRRAGAGMCDPNLGVTTYRKHISYILLFFANKATSNYAYGWSRPVCTKCFLFLLLLLCSTGLLFSCIQLQVVVCRHRK